MKIAILGAMSEEIAPILDNLEYKSCEYAGNKFYEAKYANHDLVIAHSRIGKVNSAITATILIEKFGIQKLLFSGVGGALNSDLKIADLVYANSLVQHDLDISAFGHPYGYVPGIEVFTKADESLIKIALKVASDLGLEIKSGIIASGDQFICDDKKKKWIRDTFNADVAEMEGASVAQVCTQLEVPFFIMRSISDSADGSAEINFDEFLELSAKTSADFILNMVKYI